MAAGGPKASPHPARQTVACASTPRRLPRHRACAHEGSSPGRRVSGFQARYRGCCGSRRCLRSRRSRRRRPWVRRRRCPRPGRVRPPRRPLGFSGSRRSRFAPPSPSPGGPRRPRPSRPRRGWLWTKAPPARPASAAWSRGSSAPVGSSRATWRGVPRRSRPTRSPSGQWGCLWRRAMMSEEIQSRKSRTLSFDRTRSTPSPLASDWQTSPLQQVHVWPICGCSCCASSQRADWPQRARSPRSTRSCRRCRSHRPPCRGGGTRRTSSPQHRPICND
mmetsp:Transcript_121172/g.387046  ORF Transcript_121172/g.387046 Transcript_121172/m.387046 type:complete len:276 (-) Transcript_121172:1435-2262(-)